MTLTQLGTPILYEAPEKQVVILDDIYDGLRREYRYGGRVDWTVLEHLYLCKEIAQYMGLPPLVVAHCAMHDFAEAYMRDVPTDLKDLLPGFREMEHKFMVRIYDSVGLPMPTPEEEKAVKEIDLLALEAECWHHRFHPTVVKEQVGTFSVDARDLIEDMCDVGDYRSGLRSTKLRDRRAYDQLLFWGLECAIDEARYSLEGA